MSYIQLSLYERFLINHLTMRGIGPLEMGRRINRSASTISREIRRNHGPVRDIYWFVTADEFARQKRKETLRPKKSRNSPLYRYIVDRL
jgi:IS30 family transposase